MKECKNCKYYKEDKFGNFDCQFYDKCIKYKQIKWTPK